MNWLIRISGILVVVGTTASIQRMGPTLPSDVRVEYDRIQTTLDYNNDVKPILSDKCFACHGPDKAKQQAGLRLDKSEAAFALLPENPGKRAIVPKNISASEAVRRILSKDPEEVMPTPASHLMLTAREGRHHPLDRTGRRVSTTLGLRCTEESNAAGDPRRRKPH